MANDNEAMVVEEKVTNEGVVTASDAEDVTVGPTTWNVFVGKRRA